VKTDAVPELVQRMTTGQLGPLLQEACVRPHGRTAAKRADRQLPLLVLKVDTPNDGHAVAEYVVERCGKAEPYRIPCHKVRLRPSPPDNTELTIPLRDALDEIRSKFRDVEHRQFGAFKFARYELVKQLLAYTLTHQHPADTGQHLRVELRKHLLAGDAPMTGIIL